MLIGDCLSILVFVLFSVVMFCPGGLGDEV